MSIEETYLPCVGFEGLYEVSNLGNVRSVDRVLRINRKGTQYQVFYPSMLISIRVSSCGYCTVAFQKDGKGSTQLVHRLVAQAFIPNSENKRTVNHKDGNKRNNNLSNLEWMTHGENIRHALDNGLSNPNTSAWEAAGQLACCKPVKILETGQCFISSNECSRFLKEKPSFVDRIISRTPDGYSTKLDLHFVRISMKDYNDAISGAVELPPETATAVSKLNRGLYIAQYVSELLKLANVLHPVQSVIELLDLRTAQLQVL